MELVASVLGKLGFDWRVALANLVNFLIIYFLLKKVIFDKLADAISERQKKAAANVAFRKSLDEEKASFDAFKEVELRQISKERMSVLSDAERQKHELLMDAEKRARETAHTITRKAQTDAQIEIVSL